MNKNKTTIALASILMFAMAMSLFALPIANAHMPPGTKASYAFMVAAPNPVGVGQRTYISMWVDIVLPSADVLNDIRRRNYTLTITDPDGKPEKFQWDVIQDTTGIQFMSYTPTKVGTYTLKFDYGGQIFTWGTNTPFIGTNWIYQNDTFLPATTTITLTVKEERLPDPITSYPLPTEYWARPIEAQNTDWWAISSNWLGEPYIERRTQRYGTAPNSPHIMWTRSIDTGGVVGGVFGDIEGEGFYMGRSYNSRFSYPIVMNGILYYELPLGNSGQGGGWMAVDLRTGETIWYNDKIGAYVSRGPGRSDHETPARILPTIRFGYYCSIDSPNQHGVIPQGLLWAANFETAYDPLTGRVMYNTTGVPSGAEVAGPKGEILRYVINSAGKWLAQWNSSRMWTYGWTSEGGTTPAFGVTLNATYELVSGQSCYDWNVTIPNLGPGTWSVPTINSGRTSNNAVSVNNILLLTQGSLGSWSGIPPTTGMNVTAVSLKPESRGTILWTKYYPPPPGNRSRWIFTWDPQVGVFVMYERETFKRYGYSLADGSLLWETDSSGINHFAWFDYFFPGFAAYGNLYYSGYCGVLYCWDMKTGKLKWTYGNGGVPGNSTFDVQQSWGLRPLMIQVIADGKIYCSGDEHSPNTPLYKDNLVRCINATDGSEIWTMKGWIPGTGGGGQPENSFVADGFFGYLNLYDMKIYVIGKGPSSISVSIQDDVVTHGSKVLVKGSVVDISAGTRQKEQAARFPNGVPAVADESMSAWMEYVYMQKPRPADVKGVEVVVSVLDPNNNCYEVGRAVSDANGLFSVVFEPPVPGKYTVIAEFKGSESYWPSHAETALFVEEAPPASPPPTPAPQEPVGTYFAVSTVVLLVAIAIVAVLLLRKR
ncbi:MAG: PQQ-binding-like beta-propeller repeat protein [Candidatus Bathyarchaeia archaeon]